MTQIAFVNPLDASVSTRTLGMMAPPLNLLYLAGAVEKAGFFPHIIDANLLKATPEKGAGMAGSPAPAARAAEVRIIRVVSELYQTGIVSFRPPWVVPESVCGEIP